MYYQVVIVRHKTKVNKGKNISNSKETYLFQGQSEISKHWFDIDNDWIEDNFMTREPESFKRLLQRYIEFQSGKNFLHSLCLLKIQNK